MDHLNFVTVAAIKTTVFALGLISLLTTVVVTTGVIPYVHRGPPHPYTQLRQAYMKPPQKPRFVKPVQVVVHLDKAQQNPVPGGMPLNWSDDLIKDPDFNASYGMDQLIGQKAVNISGIALDLFMIAVPSSPITAGSTTSEGQQVKFQTFMPSFKHLLPGPRVSMLYALETMMRLFAHLMLYNNYVIASANIFDPKSIMVLVVFLGVTFSFNHSAASWHIWFQFRAKVTTLISLRLAPKDLISAAEHDKARCERAEASASKAMIDLSDARQQTSAAVGRAEEVSERADLSEKEVARQAELLDERSDRIGSLETYNSDISQKLDLAETRADSNERKAVRLQKELDELKKSSDDRAEKLRADLESLQRQLDESLEVNTDLSKQLDQTKSVARELTHDVGTLNGEVGDLTQQVESLQGQVDSLEHQLADSRTDLAVELGSNVVESGSVEEHEPHSEHGVRAKERDSYDVLERLLDNSIENKEGMKKNRMGIDALRLKVEALWQRVPKEVSSPILDNHVEPTAGMSVSLSGDQEENKLGDEHLVADALLEPANHENQELRDSVDNSKDESSNEVQQAPALTAAPSTPDRATSNVQPSLPAQQDPHVQPKGDGSAGFVIFKASGRAREQSQAGSGLVPPQLDPRSKPAPLKDPETGPKPQTKPIAPHLRPPPPPPQQSPQVQPSEADKAKGISNKEASDRARQQPQSGSGLSTPQQSAPTTSVQPQRGGGSPVTAARGSDQLQHGRGLPATAQRGRDQFQHGRGSPFLGGHAPRGQDQHHRGRGVQDPNGPLHRYHDHAQQGRGPAVPRGPANRGQDHQHRGHGAQGSNGPLARNQNHAQQGRGPTVPRGAANRGQGNERGRAKNESKKEAELREEREDFYGSGEKWNKGQAAG